MAKLKRSFVRIRFSLGQAPTKARQRYSSFEYQVKNIAVNYAESEYETIRKTLTDGVAADIRRELVNLTSLYRRFIIGAKGTTSKPAGVLKSVIGGAEPLPLASVLPEWAPRNASYLKRKFEARAGKNWFDNRKWSARPGAWTPELTGHLFESMRADVWEEMFGPIKVTFRRDNRTTQIDNTIVVEKGKKVKVQIGTLAVTALGNITPNMLPGLAANTINVASAVGNPRLIGLVYDYDEDLGKRLGNTSQGRYRPGAKGPYRPTLEPFLGYFLTRSIPAAISARISQGSLKRIIRSS